MSSQSQTQRHWDELFDIRASTLVSHIEVVHISRDLNGLTDQLAKNAAARHWEPVYSGVRAPTVARARVWTVKRLVERDGNVVLVEWEGFVDPGSYTWESVSNLQNDLGIDVLTDLLDALPQVEGARDLQEVHDERYIWAYEQ